MKNYIQEMGNWGAECRLYFFISFLIYGGLKKSELYQLTSLNPKKMNCTYGLNSRFNLYRY